MSNDRQGRPTAFNFPNSVRTFGRGDILETADAQVGKSRSWNKLSGVGDGFRTQTESLNTVRPRNADAGDIIRAFDIDGRTSLFTKYNVRSIVDREPAGTIRTALPGESWSHLR